MMERNRLTLAFITKMGVVISYAERVNARVLPCLEVTRFGK